MRDWKKNSFPSVVTYSSRSGETGLLPGYHGVTPTRALEYDGNDLVTSELSIECQLTIRNKINLNRHQLCLLTGQALREVITEGLSVSDYFLLEYLYSNLLGNKLDPLQRHDPVERELSLLLRIVLLSGSKEFIPMTGLMEIPEDIKEIVDSSQWVPSERTYASRDRTYSLKKFFEVRIVPLDLYLDRPKDTCRYSSYCKGYGESNHMGRRKKTPVSAELDGEEPKEEKIDLFYIPRLLDLTKLETKYSFRRKRD